MSGAGSRSEEAVSRGSLATIRIDLKRLGAYVLLLAGGVGWGEQLLCNVDAGNGMMVAGAASGGLGWEFELA